MLDDVGFEAFPESQIRRIWIRRNEFVVGCGAVVTKKLQAPRTSFLRPKDTDMSRQSPDILYFFRNSTSKLNNLFYTPLHSFFKRFGVRWYLFRYW